MKCYESRKLREIFVVYTFIIVQNNKQLKLYLFIAGVVLLHTTGIYMFNGVFLF